MGMDDKIKNAAEATGGKIKEKAGEATGNTGLEAEGKTEQSKAKLKQAGEKLKDAVDDVKDSLDKYKD